MFTRSAANSACSDGVVGDEDDVAGPVQLRLKGLAELPPTALEKGERAGDEAGGLQRPRQGHAWRPSVPPTPGSSPVALRRRCRRGAHRVPARLDGGEQLVDLLVRLVAAARDRVAHAVAGVIGEQLP